MKNILPLLIMSSVAIGSSTHTLSNAPHIYLGEDLESNGDGEKQIEDPNYSLIKRKEFYFSKNEGENRLNAGDFE